MANLIKMPLSVNLPWYEFNMVLEQVTYGFELAYNTRAARWHLSVLDAAGQSLVRGIPLLIDRDLLASYRYLDVPPGVLVCLDSTGKQQQPTLGSFLTGHNLFYLESTYT